VAERSKRAFLALPEDPGHFVIRSSKVTQEMRMQQGLRQHGAMILPWWKPGNGDERALAKRGG
jgi:hypothetical protein